LHDSLGTDAPIALETGVARWAEAKVVLAKVSPELIRLDHLNSISDRLNVR
jgi:hypothetical protein